MSNDLSGTVAPDYMIHSMLRRACVAIKQSVPLLVISRYINYLTEADGMYGECCFPHNYGTCSIISFFDIFDLIIF